MNEYSGVVGFWICLRWISGGQHLRITRLRTSHWSVAVCSSWTVWCAWKRVNDNWRVCNRGQQIDITKHLQISHIERVSMMYAFSTKKKTLLLLLFLPEK